MNTLQLSRTIQSGIDIRMGIYTSGANVLPEKY